MDIAPNTKLTLEFDQTGRVRVTLEQGCAIVRTKKGATGEIYTSKGAAGKTDSDKDGALDVCFAPGSAGPVVNEGAATNAGAGVGGVVAAGGGLGGGAIAAIVVGGTAGAVGIGLALRGGNPSGS